MATIDGIALRKETMLSQAVEPGRVNHVRFSIRAGKLGEFRFTPLTTDGQVDLLRCWISSERGEVLALLPPASIAANLPGGASRMGKDGSVLFPSRSGLNTSVPTSIQYNPPTPIDLAATPPPPFWEVTLVFALVFAASFSLPRWVGRSAAGQSAWTCRSLAGRAFTRGRDPSHRRHNFRGGLLLPGDLLWKKLHLPRQRCATPLRAQSDRAGGARRPRRKSRGERHGIDALLVSACFDDPASGDLSGRRITAVESLHLVRCAAVGAMHVDDARGSAALAGCRDRWGGLGLGFEVPPRESALCFRRWAAGPHLVTESSGRAAHHAFRAVYRVLCFSLLSSGILCALLRALDSVAVARGRPCDDAPSRGGLGGVAPLRQLVAIQQRHGQGIDGLPPLPQCHGRVGDSWRALGPFGESHPAWSFHLGERALRAPRRAFVADLHRRPGQGADGLR